MKSTESARDPSLLPPSGGQAADGGAPLRVVHVVYCFRTGGMEKGIVTCIRNASPDLRHVIVCLTVSGEMERLLPPQTPLLALDKPPGNSVRFLWKLAGVLRSLAPCVVHTRNWSGMDGIIAARLAGIRAVVHGEHGWEALDPRGDNRKRLVVRRVLSGRVKRITCVSRDLAVWLRDRVRVRCPVEQIYNGIDLAPYAGNGDGRLLRAEFGIEPEAPVFGIVGRLDPIKDHETIFRALTRLRQRVPAARLLCIGDGPERKRLEALAPPGVLMTGERKDIPALLGALDLFVLASRNEGVSNTILEAMAAGLPVAASRVGGNPELVVEGETGRLFAPGDDEGLAAILADYAAHPGIRRAHGAAGRERVRREFGLPGMVASYEAVWRACAAAPRRA